MTINGTVIAMINGTVMTMIGTVTAMINGTATIATDPVIRQRFKEYF
jgi:hypothetical protein